MSKNTNPKHVVTGKVRFCYPRLFKPESFEGQEPKYSICILIPADDKKTLKKIDKAIEAAKEDGIQSTWGGKEPKKLTLPLHDGEERDGAEYEGTVFLNARTKRKPSVVDKDLEPIDELDADEIYPGCYGRIGLDFFAYDTAGNKGIGVSFSNVQKLKDGERLGGVGASIEDDFDDDFEDDDDDDF